MTDQEKFIQQIKSYRDYWLALEDKTAEEILDGAIFSLLVMIDGYSSVNDFHPLKIIDTETGKRLDCGYLHDLFCETLKADRQTKAAES